MSTSDPSGTAGLAGPSDQRPLSDQEYQLLQRLLGDPFSFPITFKTWLISYLEGSDLSMPLSSVNGLTSILGISGVGSGTMGILPAGLIFPFGGDIAPAGSLLCDGGSYLRTTQARLFNAIGVRFGSVDANSFSVPDLRGRVPAGKGTHVSVDTVGKNDGVALDSRSPIHRTSDKGFANAGVTAGSDENMLIDAATNEQGMHHHGPDNMSIDAPAYEVVSFIIVA